MELIAKDRTISLYIEWFHAPLRWLVVQALILISFYWTMPTLTFNNAEVELLARTADALSAYIGKPVLAEIMDAEETGYEWVAFAIPLDINEDDTNIPVIQIGGAKARLIGSQGGVHIDSNETYSCRFLWAIQCADLGPVRYIKVNQEGDEIGWAETLTELLPFDFDEAADNEGEPSVKPGQLFIQTPPSQLQ